MKNCLNTCLIFTILAFVTLLSLFDFKIVSATHSNFDLANLKEVSPTSTLAYDKIKIQPAWEFIKGLIPPPPFTEVIIGVLDEGFDISHLEFVGVNPGRTPPAISKDSHGTAVAGIIGANNISATSSANYIFPQMNGIVSGVLPKEKYVLGMRAPIVSSTSTRPNEIFEDPLDELIAGQAQFINISLGAARENALTDAQKKVLNFIPDEDFDFYTQFFGEYFKKQSSTLFIISAGNENVSSTHAAFIAQATSTENVIIAGATELDDTRMNGFTASGVEFGSVYGPGVALAAPGESIYAPAVSQPPRNVLNFNDYWHPFNTTPTSTDPIDVRRFFGGTSGAAPLVTGVAAILKSLESEYQKFTPGLLMTPAKIKEILIKSADPIITDQPLGRDCFNFNPNVHNGCRENSHRAIAWFFPPASSILNFVSSTSNSITLSWTKSDDFKNPDFNSYKLFRSVSSPVTQSSTPIFSTNNSSTLTFTNTVLSPNATFFYKLFTFDKAGLSSESNEISAQTLSAIPKPPKPYTLNTHTLFYTPLDNFYNFSGGTFIPELVDTPAIPDPDHDCRITFQAKPDSYTLESGQFNNALRAKGSGRLAFRPPFTFIPEAQEGQIFCNNRPLRLIGNLFPDYTVGFWLKTFSKPIDLGYIFFMVRIAGDVRPIWILLGPQGELVSVTHPPGPLGNILRSFNPKIIDNQFHHYLVVFNHTQRKMDLFIDGILDQQIPIITDILPSGDNALELLLSDTTRGFFPNVALDDFFVENRAWTQQDITKFLSSGDVPLNNPHPSPLPDPNILPDIPLPSFVTSTLFSTSTAP